MDAQPFFCFFFIPFVSPAVLSRFFPVISQIQGSPSLGTTPVSSRKEKAAAASRTSGTTPSSSRKGRGSRQSPAAGAGAGATGAGREDGELAPAGATAVVQHVLYPAFRYGCFSAFFTQLGHCFCLGRSMATKRSALVRWCSGDPSCTLRVERRVR